MKANECVDNKVVHVQHQPLYLHNYNHRGNNMQKDIVKMKAKALKEQNTKPIKALTVYPPNTPATLVPRVLPTKSQVKINIFTLRQLLSDFEKTYKKRITPTGITEGERGPILQFPKVIYNLKERKERQGPNVQTSQTPTVLTVEEGAGTFTVHPSFPKLPRYQIKGQIQIKGCVGQFKEAQAQMQGQISLIKGILILAQAQCHVSHGESTNLCGFCAKLTHKTNTNVTSKNASLAILRCPQNDPTSHNIDQMIEEMIGQD
ncbi:hypothetical protein Tco_0421100 [Tanacetum coccineum]